MLIHNNQILCFFFFKANNYFWGKGKKNSGIFSIRSLGKVAAGYVPILFKASELALPTSKRREGERSSNFRPLWFSGQDWERQSVQRQSFPFHWGPKVPAFELAIVHTSQSQVANWRLHMKCVWRRCESSFLIPNFNPTIFSSVFTQFSSSSRLFGETPKCCYT